jgi:hypothetical protein
MDVRSYSTIVTQIIKRKLNNPVEKPQGSMESFVNVCKHRSNTKTVLPNEWKTRWMVLYTDKIVFYKSENKEKPKEIILHYSIRSVLALENEISNLSNWFEIITKKTTFVLHAFHHRHKTEKLLFCWLVAIHNSLTQSLDWRDTENIDKLTLQIENYNQKISTRKRLIRLQKEKDRQKKEPEIQNMPTIQSDIKLVFPTEKGTPSHPYRRSDRRYNRDTSRGRDTGRLPLSVREKPKTRKNLLQIANIEDLTANVSESVIISESSDLLPSSTDFKLNSRPFADLTFESPKMTKFYSSRALIPELEAPHKEKENLTPRRRNSLSKNEMNDHL